MFQEVPLTGLSFAEGDRAGHLAVLNRHRRRERKRTASPFLRFLGILTWKAVSVRQLVRLLEDDGWVEVRQRGSHRQFRHPTKSGTVTVAGNESADVPPGTLNSVLKQAGLKNQR
jgi:predicted RNA binding protein YcfA (HicA-like mRNA interferase family)